MSEVGGINQPPVTGAVTVDNKGNEALFGWVVKALVSLLDGLVGPLKKATDGLKFADKYAKFFALIQALLTGDPKDVATEQRMEKVLKEFSAKNLAALLSDPRLSKEMKTRIQDLLKNPGYQALYNDLVANQALTAKIAALKKEIAKLPKNSPERKKLGEQLKKDEGALKSLVKKVEDVDIGQMIQKGKPTDPTPGDGGKELLPTTDPNKPSGGSAEYQKQIQEAMQGSGYFSSLEQEYKALATMYMNRGMMVVREASKLLKQQESVFQFLNRKVLE